MEDRFKFRAWWDGSNDCDARMVGWEEICSEFMPYGEIIPIERNPGWTLMQCTGIRDATRSKEFPNGKLIYEGDIVALGELNNNLSLVGYVKMSQGCWCIQLRDHRTPILSKFICEILGNKYENPELLEQSHGR